MADLGAIGFAHSSVGHCSGAAWWTNGTSYSASKSSAIQSTQWWISGASYSASKARVIQSTQWWINGTLKSASLVKRQLVAIWAWGYVDNPHTVPTTGIITIATKIQGANVAGQLVRLYYRPTGQMISQGRSDSTGLIIFNGINPTGNIEDYYAIHFDMDGIVPKYNAAIEDFLSADP